MGVRIDTITPGDGKEVLYNIFQFSDECMLCLFNSLKHDFGEFCLGEFQFQFDADGLCMTGRVQPHAQAA